MVGYFRDHVRDMATRTVHLRSLLRKGVPFNWTSSHEEEFMDLKNALTSPDTLLLHPDFTKHLRNIQMPQRMGVVAC